MAKRSSNGKTADVQVRILTSIDEKLSLLVGSVARLEAGQERLEAGQERLTQRIDNMLQFIGEHYRDHDKRLASVEARLSKAGF